MTKDKDDTSPKSLILEDNIPLPRDRRLGTGERLPIELKATMGAMKVGQSFFLPMTNNDKRHPVAIAAIRAAKIAAIRASIARYVDQDDSPINEDWLFSVRRENTGTSMGVRVFRMENKGEADENHEPI